MTRVHSLSRPVMSLKAADGCSNRDSGAYRPCVLIVDDEESVRTALMRYFARRGWNVCEAEDGEEARAMLAPNACAFDLAICDLRMPRMSGPDFYRWLAQSRPDVASRLVFSSGDVDCPESAAFLSDAGRPVLSKPFDLCDLARLIDEIRGAARAA